MHEDDRLSQGGDAGERLAGKQAGADPGRQQVRLFLAPSPQGPLRGAYEETAGQRGQSWREKGTHPAASPGGPSGPSLPELVQVVSEAQAPCPAGTRLTSCEGANSSNPSFPPVHYLQVVHPGVLG